MKYHERHLCARCGGRYGEHAAAGNPHCPEGRCPGALKFPRVPEPGNLAELERFDQAVHKFWNARTTTFRPV